VRFFARGSVPGGLRVFVATSQTALEGHGGFCQVACSDHYGTDVSPADGWTEFVLPFVDMRQQYDVPTNFDLTSVLSVEFHVYPNGQAYDYWVDDVAFYR
jgi:hypothetical protein